MNKLFLIAVLITAILASCKKDSTTTPTCKIITITPVPLSGTNQIYSFTYNSDFTVSNSYDTTSVTTYAYSGSTVIATTLTAGVFNSKRIVTLNGNGMASNVRIENNAAGTNWTNQAFEYSGTEIIKSTNTSSAGGTAYIVTLNWNGGNLVSATSGSTTSILEYYTDILAQTGDYLDMVQLEAGYRIYKTKNAVKSLISGSSILNFSYSRDANGKITSMIITSGSIVTYNYQYQCN